MKELNYFKFIIKLLETFKILRKLQSFQLKFCKNIYLSADKLK